MSEEMPERMRGDLLKEMLRQILGEIPEGFQEEMPEEIPEEMSEAMHPLPDLLDLDEFINSAARLEDFPPDHPIAENTPTVEEVMTWFRWFCSVVGSLPPALTSSRARADTVGEAIYHRAVARGVLTTRDCGLSRLLDAVYRVMYRFKELQVSELGGTFDAELTERRLILIVRVGARFQECIVDAAVTRRLQRTG